MSAEPGAVRRVARFAARLVGPFLDARSAARVALEVPWYARTLRDYARRSHEEIPALDLHPAWLDRAQAAGTASGHYFHQDLWAARQVFRSGVDDHVDVGSRVDGFVAHCASFAPVTYVDIRPFGTPVEGIQCVSGSVLALPFADRTLRSLSCLHVIEHVGLGRYGDPLEPEGSRLAMKELARVVAPGGSLYLGVPIGRERVCFNAHRVLAPATVLRELSQLELVAFAAVNDRGHLVDPARPDDFVTADYACGLFHFRRPR
ncbi:MAG: DUF268 domain-containing protein [Sandaracinaceae bacterium]|nr:DUF268 domain-containing protein [Sandaracinaceae bacterium]